MGGDGMSGLSMAILVAMTGFLVGGFLVFFLIGRSISRHRGGGNRLGWLLGLLGVAAGILAIYATFFESTWSPPPTIRLVTPQDFAHPNVILLLDRNAPEGLDWQGFHLPFSGQTTTLAVPAGGVVRLNDLGPLYGRTDVTVEWPDGATSMSGGGGPAPPGLNAESYTILVRDNGPESPEPPYSDPTAMGEYIRTREVQR